MANRYWVGGTDNWDATAGSKWALTSGGAGGQAVPTSSDDVFFDANSGANTVTVSATATCQNLDFTGFTGTFAGSSALDIYGNLTLGTGMTKTHSGATTFRATSGTKTITSGGKSFIGTIVFNGSGGTFQLVDQLETIGSLTLTAGSFDPNGKTVLFSGIGTQNTIAGAFTFFNLTLGGSNGKDFLLNSNITITGTFSITQTSRVYIRSGIIGTARTITSAINSLQYANLRDITGAGAASWNLSAITGLSGDCGGNSGITFTTGATQYWKTTTTGSKLWSTAGNWFLATNGGGGAGRVPLPQDDVVFDANSIGAASTTITADVARLGKSIDWTGVTNTPTFTTSTAASIFGSLTLVSGMTLTASTQAYTFEGRSTYTLTNAGLTWAKSITLVAPGGMLTLQDDLSSGSANTLAVSNGTFDANDKNINFGNFSSSSSNTRSVLMGSGIWTLNATFSIWTMASSGLTFDAETSTIKIIDTANGALTFAGGGLTYNNLWFDRDASTGSLTISDSNTFADFKDTGTVAHSLIFTASTTTTVTTFTVSGSAGNLITITSTSATDFNLVKSGGGTIERDYLNIQNCDATPSITWYAGNHSVDNQASSGGTGWIFTAVPITYNLAVTVGAFVLTGVSALFSKGLGMVAEGASFALTYMDITIQVMRHLAVTVGEFILTGIDATLIHGVPYGFTATVANFTLNGIDAIIRATPRLMVSVGAFVLGGQDADLRRKGFTNLSKSTTTYNDQSKNTSICDNVEKS